MECEISGKIMALTHALGHTLPDASLMVLAASWRHDRAAPRLHHRKGSVTLCPGCAPVMGHAHRRDTSTTLVIQDPCGRRWHASCFIISVTSPLHDLPPGVAPREDPPGRRHAHVAGSPHPPSVVPGIPPLSTAPAPGVYAHAGRVRALPLQTCSETSSVSIINAYRAAVWCSRHDFLDACAE
jgi:hypothetical protein